MASEPNLTQPMTVTRGSVLVADQTGGGSSATGNPLTSQAPVARYLAGNSALANRGDGAVTSDEFGIVPPRADIALVGISYRPH